MILHPKRYGWLLLLALATACGGGQTAQTALQEEPKGQLPEGAVPFAYRHHLYFDAVVRDSIPARLIFDSGNTHLLLDSTFYAEKFGRSGTLRKSMLGGAGGGMELASIDASGWSYRIGDHAMQEAMAVVLNLRKIVGNAADGMFGMTFMQGRKVSFNYADGYMELLPADFQPDSSYHTIPCRWLDAGKMRLKIPMRLTFSDQSTLDGEFLVDMGASSTLVLGRGAAPKIRPELLANAPKMHFTVGGIGGSSTEHILALDGVEVGGFRLPAMHLFYSNNTQGSLASTAHAGLVGNALLERFDVIFDFAACNMYLRPNRNFDRPFPTNNAGFALTPYADHWVVNGLQEESAAERSGLRRGDKVLTINGLTTAELTPNELDKQIAKKQPWHLVVERNGRQFEIKFDHK